MEGKALSSYCGVAFYTLAREKGVNHLQWVVGSRWMQQINTVASAGTLLLYHGTVNPRFMN